MPISPKKTEFTRRLPASACAVLLAFIVLLPVILPRLGL